MSQPLVLGIETSCDETAVGIVRGRTLLANVISSSVEEHARFGGVVPEIASRAHLEAMTSVITRALAEAKVSLSDVDAFAVTAGPGLIGALIVGVSSAQGLALALEKPIYGVNHLSAHIAVDSLNSDHALDPAIALLVSGGHSSILQVNEIASDVMVLGSTIDDAAGMAVRAVVALSGTWTLLSSRHGMLLLSLVLVARGVLLQSLHWQLRLEVTPHSVRLLQPTAVLRGELRPAAQAGPDFLQ